MFPCGQRNGLTSYGGPTICVALVLLLTSAATAADGPISVLETATEFVQSALADTVVTDMQSRGLRTHPVYGIQLVNVTCTALDRTSKVDVHLGIHPERRYVMSYTVDLDPSSTRPRSPQIAPDAAIEKATEFARRSFPNWGDQMVLQSARQGAICGEVWWYYWWRGMNGRAETGDVVVLAVGPDGQIGVYNCNAARKFTREGVRITRSDALNTTRSMLQQKAPVPMTQIRTEAVLVLSHPQAPGEGPVWRVTATRPSSWASGGELELVRYVDGRTGDLITPFESAMLDRLFFGGQ